MLRRHLEPAIATVRQWQRLDRGNPQPRGHLLLDGQARVLLSSPLARLLIHASAAPAQVLSAAAPCLHGDLLDWVQRELRHRQGPEPWAHPARELELTHQQGKMTIRLANAPQPGLFLLLLEEGANLPQSPLARPLSAREREVLECLAAGQSNAEIAHQLHISIHTVKTHVKKILETLRLKSRSAAAAWLHGQR